MRRIGRKELNRERRVGIGKGSERSGKERRFNTIFRSVYSVSVCCSVYCLCVNVYWTTATGISGHFSTTLTEGFPCFFLSCKANARV
jgi:hypothetical protein